MSESDKHFWEEAYQEYPEQVEVTDYVLDAEIKGLIPANLLDIGCGTGKNVFKLAELGWEVYGIDISERAIELAKVKAAKRKLKAEFYAVDSTIWEPPHTFKLVLSTYALPGGDTTKKTLNTAIKALDPGGTLIITEWDKSMSEVWEFMKDDLSSPEEIAAMLPGLEIEKAEVLHVENMFAKDDHRAVAGTWANVSLVRAMKPR
ncbi:MAG: class I SAM-dependent methyltransferase [Thermodesulfobacteriota bacterium]